MLTQAALAAVLLLPPSLQTTPPAPLPPPPAATAPAATQPAATDQSRLDQLLVARFKSELAQPLTDMGWPAEDQEAFAQRFLPSLFRTRLKVRLTPEDDARFSRLRPRTAVSPDTGKEAPLRDDELVVAWVRSARTCATVHWPAPRDSPSSANMTKDLKPGLLRLWINTRCDKPINVAASAQHVADDLAGALADPDLAGEKARLIAYVLSGLNEERTSIETIARATAIYASRPDADKWFVDYLTGIVETKIAWIMRGADIAARTTEAQFRAFFSHLGKAEAALTRAHKARPNWPEPAQAMITVAMGQGDGARHTPLYWYEQAVKSDPSDSRAAAALASAASPKWSNDAGKAWIDRIVADAAASQDFTSAVPSMAATAMITYAKEVGGSAAAEKALKARGVYERLRDVFTGYLNAKDPAVAPDAARFWLLYIGHVNDKPAEVLALLDTVQADALSPGAPPMSSPFGLRVWATLALSPEKDAISTADKLLWSGDTEVALRAFEAIVPRLTTGEDAALVKSRIALITRLRRAAAENKPTEVLLLEKAGEGATQSLHCLSLFQNSWSGRVEPIITPRGPSAALCFTRGRNTIGGTGFALPVQLDMFKDGYELTFDAYLRGIPGSASPSVLVQFSRAAHPGGLDRTGPSIQLTADGARFDSLHSENPAQLKQTLTESHQRVRVLVVGWKAEVWCNDTLADWCAGPGAAKRRQNPGACLGFVDGGVWQGDIRIENLTIAPLTKPLEDRPARGRPAPKVRSDPPPKY